MEEKDYKKHLNGTFISKKEAEKRGFNYSAYLYEAKMVGAPGQLVVNSIFRITGDPSLGLFAITINKDGNDYFIVKVDDPLNPGIKFVKIEEEGSPLINVATKGIVYGSTFNNIELIEALKNPLFQNDSPVIVDCPGGEDEEGGLIVSGEITAIFKCPDCNNLHISCDSEDELYGRLDGAKVYLNRSYQKQKPFTRKDLLAVLESITEIIPITIEGADGENYTLTNVSKCPHCPAIHLDCFYDNNHSHGLN